MLDLIETRMSSIENWDDETERELRRLGACRRELMGGLGPASEAEKEAVANASSAAEPDILRTH